VQQFTLATLTDNKRGFYTSFIQITAILALFLSYCYRGHTIGVEPEDFADWGWVFPFYFLLFSWPSRFIPAEVARVAHFRSYEDCRKNLYPTAQRRFHQMSNLKQVLISLFGAAAGQEWSPTRTVLLSLLSAVILKMNPARQCRGGSGLRWHAFLIVFGALSDKLGVKKS